MTNAIKNLAYQIFMLLQKHLRFPSIPLSNKEAIKMTLLQAGSLLILSVGVLINALLLPPYPGAAIIGDEKKQWLYNFRKYIGSFANILISLGTLGQIVSIYIQLFP
jgi:hypothetical protein